MDIHLVRNSLNATFSRSQKLHYARTWCSKRNYWCKKCNIIISLAPLCEMLEWKWPEDVCTKMLLSTAEWFHIRIERKKKYPTRMILDIENSDWKSGFGTFRPTLSSQIHIIHTVFFSFEYVDIWLKILLFRTQTAC